MKNLLIITILLFLSSLLFAQPSPPISGRILDASSREGVPFAIISMEGQYLIADEAGYFEVHTSQLLPLTLEIQQIGYETLRFVLAKDQTSPLSLELKSKPVVLEQILVQEQPLYGGAQSFLPAGEERQAAQPRDVGDLFGSIPGFSVIKKGGYALDPVFRSFKYEQINVIYDGGLQTTHACPARMDPTTTHINPEEIEKLELIKGPFSMRYGPSMGAIVNVVTRSLENPDRLGFGGSMEAAYETNGSSRVSKLALQGAGRQVDFLLNGGLKDYGNYQSGNNTEIPSSFQTYDYGLKLGYRLPNNQRLQGSWRQSFSRDVLHAGLGMDTDSDNTSIFSLDYQYKNISPKLYSVSAKAYGTWVDHLMSNLRRPNARMMEMVSTVQAQTFGGRMEATWMPGKKVLLYTGVDYRYLWRDGEGRMTTLRNMMGELLSTPTTMLSSSWQNSTIQNGGLFAEGRWFINPRWSILLGARADWTTASIAEPAADFLALYGGNVAAKDQLTYGATASASWQSPSDWIVQLALGRGARTANMIERVINRFNVGRDPYEYVGNPYLQPEVNHQAEFSLSRKTERFNVRSSLFYSYISNYIAAGIDTTLRARSMSGPRFARRFTNLDAVSQWGMELQGDYTLLKNMRLRAALAFTQARNLEWKEALAEVSPLEIDLGVRYERSRWWIDLQGRLVDNQDRISAIFGETATPGFCVFDVQAGLEPFKGISLGLAVWNIFDRQYREHLNRAYKNLPVSGVIYEPGRNLSFFAKYRF